MNALFVLTLVLALVSCASAGRALKQCGPTGCPATSTATSTVALPASHEPGWGAIFGGNTRGGDDGPAFGAIGSPRHNYQLSDSDTDSARDVPFFGLLGQPGAVGANKVLGSSSSAGKGLNIPFLLDGRSLDFKRLGAPRLGGAIRATTATQDGNDRVAKAKLRMLVAQREATSKVGNKAQGILKSREACRPNC